jgi:hypothetical protein
MLLFRSEEHVHRWCQQRGVMRGGLLTLDQTWRLAQRWYRSRMAPDYRRATLQEAQAVFNDIGLTGPFWQLPG